MNRAVDSSALERLYDIETIVEIPDFSLYIFISLAIFLALLVAIAIWKLLYRKKIDSKKERALKILKNLELDKTKESAYAISRFGKYLVYDDRSVDIYNSLLSRLEKYKYKKEVESFDEETIKNIELFLLVTKNG